MRILDETFKLFPRDVTRIETNFPGIRSILTERSLYGSDGFTRSFFFFFLVICFAKRRNQRWWRGIHLRVELTRAIDGLAGTVFLIFLRPRIERNENVFCLSSPLPSFFLFLSSQLSHPITLVPQPRERLIIRDVNGLEWVPLTTLLTGNMTNQ